MLEDFANLDYERERRCGFPEVVFGLGKTAEQTLEIVAALLEQSEIALVTRASEEHARLLATVFPETCWFPRSGILFIDHRAHPLWGNSLSEILACPSHAEGEVIVACAGTSDLPVAEEAALTARIMGSHVTFLPDVGVAGVHRTLAHTEELHAAHAIVVVAGMEGALPSLIAGLVDVPVVAVPTSVGYGAAFEGLAALLGMLNSCAGGVSVVNIDNGFGAGQIADRINRPPRRFDSGR